MSGRVWQGLGMPPTNFFLRLVRTKPVFGFSVALKRVRQPTDTQQGFGPSRRNSLIALRRSLFIVLIFRVVSVFGQSSAHALKARVKLEF